MVALGCMYVKIIRAVSYSFYELEVDIEISEGWHAYARHPESSCRRFPCGAERSALHAVPIPRSAAQSHRVPDAQRTVEIGGGGRDR